MAASALAEGSQLEAVSLHSKSMTRWVPTSWIGFPRTELPDREASFAQRARYSGYWRMKDAHASSIGKPET